MNLKLFLFLIGTLSLTSQLYSQSNENLSINYNANGEFVCVVDSLLHINYGMSYPITFKMQIPPNSNQLSVYKRSSKTKPWTEIPKKTSNDFFNGIEATRIEYDLNLAYISAAFNSDSDSILIKVVNSDGNNILLNYDGICKYYDNREAVVCATADDLDKYKINTSFKTAMEEFRSRNLWLSCGVITTRFNDDTWALLQLQLDSGFVEIVSHSRTHVHPPYDMISEIGGSKEDIISNLDLPPLFKSGEKEYVYAYLYPYGNWGSEIDKVASSYNYLICRTVAKNQFELTDWNDNLDIFDRVGEFLELGVGIWTNDEILNDSFDQVVQSKGIYHMILHPQDINWNDLYISEHLDYISNRKDMWYVGFGHLYLYNFLRINAFPPQREVEKAPEITNDLENITSLEGQITKLGIDATCYDEILYQWWQKSPNGGEDLKLENAPGLLEGVHTKELNIISPSILDSGNVYYCEVCNELDVQNLKTNSQYATLSVNKSLFITSPIKNDVFTVGQIERINLDNKSGIDELKIEYSHNNGMSWSNIGMVNSNQTYFDWVIPNTPSEECLLKIYSVSNPDIFDLMKYNFTIFLTQNVNAVAQNISSWRDENLSGKVTGNLSASSSVANYGEIISYTWTLNGDTIATGKKPLIELPTGTHSIQLDVESDQNLHNFDTLSISVLSNKIKTGEAIYSSISSVDDLFFYINSQASKMFVIDSNGFDMSTLLLDSPSSTTPMVHDHLSLFTASSSKLYSFNDVVIPNWEKELGSSITTTPSIGPNNKLCVGMENGKLYIIDSQGDILNSIQTDGNIVSSPAITDDNKIYFGSSDRNIYVANFEGEILNTYATGGHTSSPAIGKDGSIIFGCSDGKIYKLDRMLNLLWHYQTTEYIHSSPVIDEIGNIYFGSCDSLVYSLSPDGEVNWKYNANSKIYSDPTLDKYGNLYIGTEDGKLLVIKDGELKWYLKTSSSIRSACLITKSGVLLQTTTDGSIYIMSIKEASKTYSEQTYNHQWPTFKGNFQRNGYVWDGITDIKDTDESIPTKFSLSQNYPNPFNPSTKIKFGLPRESDVSVAIYNILGERVEDLVNQQLKAGFHEVEFNNTSLSSGIYFYRIEAGKYVETKKMILMK